MKRLLRTLGRMVLFPVIFGLGTLLGLLALATHPRQVATRLWAKGWGIFAGFSPEERKVVLHLALGFLALGLAVAAALLIWMVR